MTSSPSNKRDAPDDAPFVKAPFYGEHRRAISSVAMAPSKIADNKLVCASAGADGSVKLWDITSKRDTKGKPMVPVSTLIGHARGINHVSWSPKSGYIATASDDKTCRLWDATTAEAVVDFRGHSNYCFSVKFNPSSNLLCSGSFDETVKLWDVRTGDCISTIPAHSDPVTSVDFNRDGTCVVSGSHDGLVRLWDTATGECLKTTYAPTNPPVSHVQFSPNGKYVLSGTLDGKLRLWRAACGSSKCCKTYSCKEVVHSKYCIASDFVCSRQCIVTGSETGQVVLYGLNDRKVRQVLEGHSDAVLAVSAHDSQDVLCTGGMTQDKTVKFWIPKEKDDDDDEEPETKRAKASPVTAASPMDLSSS